MSSTSLTKYAPLFLSVLRIVAALVFMLHGSQKLMGIPLAEGSPEIFSKYWFAGVMELIGGALLILGLFTRPVAFLLSGLMAVAYWTAHAPKDLFPTLNGGDAAILFCFIFLYLVFAGPGPISLDTMMKRDR